MTKEDLKEDILTKDKKEDVRKIVIFNDNNSFDHVIDSLVDVCRIDPLAAEQLSLIIHYKGKASVKSGDFETLKP